MEAFGRKIEAVLVDGKCYPPEDAIRAAGIGTSNVIVLWEGHTVPESDYGAPRPGWETTGWSFAVARRSAYPGARMHIATLSGSPIISESDEDAAVYATTRRS